MNVNNIENKNLAYSIIDSLVRLANNKRKLYDTSDKEKKITHMLVDTIDNNEYYLTTNKYTNRKTYKLNIINMEDLTNTIIEMTIVVFDTHSLYHIHINDYIYNFTINTLKGITHHWKCEKYSDDKMKDILIKINDIIGIYNNLMEIKLDSIL